MSQINTIRTPIASVVRAQLPEFVREDYPTFVAFVEAYYEFLQNQGVDLTEFRDIDKTLETFVAEFKKELSYNLPNIVEDERFLLSRIRDQYLSKGSEASYKLLFKLLYGKNVRILYPAEQRLIPSDGNWNQNTTVFVKVLFGDPSTIEGKTVEIEQADTILRVGIKKNERLTGDINNIQFVGENLYELFLDKKIYGAINIGDLIRYKDLFKAEVLPTTSTVKIYSGGSGFRVGQVFELKSGTGFGTLIKATKVSATGALLNIQVIKYGINYPFDFTTSILPINSITSKTSAEVDLGLSTIRVNNGVNDFIVGLEPKLVVSENGFINNVDYITPDYVDGTYAGTILKEFSFSNEETPVNSSPAVIDVTLGTLALYPGYFETNKGFLSDSIYIQDSKYYQIYSYVVSIDERLSSYKSAVKTLIHPTGLALFGEFEISNNFDLSIELESLIKSLGLGFEELELLVTDAKTLTFFKGLSSPELVSSENITSKLFSTTKAHSVTASDSTGFLKTFSTSKANSVTILDNDFTASFGLVLGHSQNIVDQIPTLVTGLNSLVSLQTLEETSLVMRRNDIDAFLNLPIQNISTTEFGYVVLDPYEEGNYFEEIYLNNRDAIFSN
jgi:hypothetical protein